MCNECSSKVDIESLCKKLLTYVPGSGDNDLWNHIASEITGSYGFRSIVIELSEELPFPRKEYWRMLVLAGNQDYLPKNERPWLFQFYDSVKEDPGLTREEKNLVEAYVIAAHVAEDEDKEEIQS